VTEASNTGTGTRGGLMRVVKEKGENERDVERRNAVTPKAESSRA
jgi:hypothetical protein